MGLQSGFSPVERTEKFPEMNWKPLQSVSPATQKTLTAMSLYEGVLVEMQQEIMEKFSMK